ncbi:DgyrCDS5872 [Dimorphilus gyrociliatus]|uniref:DgyrCDS5872 n=1 Tax=Dimorphilus gyrociliatus TaxID=2664684 RepID=A0A7I8VMU9_9ANNE|nr:DgyrCDS5872 [Dimorphilus gyrociliatus]
MASERKSDADIESTLESLMISESDSNLEGDLDPTSNTINKLSETDKDVGGNKEDDSSGEQTKTSVKSNDTICTECNISLSGKKYLMRNENSCCVQCYEKLYSNTCEACQKVIGTEFKDVCYEDKHWHENCFICCCCEKSLVNEPFATKENSLYCANCYEEQFAMRCDSCTKPLRGGMKKFEYDGKKYHEECFVCFLCSEPIGSRSFVPREGNITCIGCYEEKFSQKCTACTKPITKGGVGYKGNPYHKDCFTCTECSLPLAGEKFASKDEQPYCINCYAKLFSKTCSRCSTAITGLDGSKAVVYEDRHWHTNCFSCSSCSTSLVGQGFVPSGSDILCEKCAQ